MHIYVVKRLREQKNPSFVIIELATNAIVDFTETSDEALKRCMNADVQGGKCKFYETSMSTIENLREKTKNVDVNQSLQGITIEDLDPNIFSEEGI